jgi:hypothetical protein
MRAESWIVFLINRRNRVKLTTNLGRSYVVQGLCPAIVATELAKHANTPLIIIGEKFPTFV